MKKFIITVSVIGLILTGYAFTQRDQSSTDSLGDVKYSILSPDQFKKVNGNGWVLLDGRKVDGSQLQKRFSIINIPDARGMFLRGLNYDRQDASIDPFFKEYGRVRLVGQFEADIVGPHNHGWTGNAGDGYPNKAEQHHSPESMRSTDPTQKSYHYPRGSEYDYAVSGVGNETRPRNIAFYIYIKIN
ncbi:hypothetical protein BDD43_3256 [Mucilaginibacter gracilis]|uniref:Tail collar domain n=1 Tax=Mucilaginibacter gracilis TaxID=423350 RepID=A0A495J256_9SPHI|nr:hypothetical protein [Mucilaginibacter gracilis]RKR83056.1 hypothetical protein BDD43_3256 [Mucilaginibacter gracilis]